LTNACHTAEIHYLLLQDVKATKTTYIPNYLEISYFDQEDKNKSKLVNNINFVAGNIKEISSNYS